MLIPCNIVAVTVSRSKNAFPGLRCVVHLVSHTSIIKLLSKGKILKLENQMVFDIRGKGVIFSKEANVQIYRWVLKQENLRRTKIK